MVLRRFFQLLLLRLGQVNLIWWLLIALIILTEIVILLKNRNKERFYKIALWCAFFPYLLFILTATVFSRTIISPGHCRISFDISTAWTIGPGIYGQIDTFTELIMNILMFVPIGYLLMKLTKKTWVALGMSFLITISIEILQLIAYRGFFELADILLNFIGAVGGWLISYVRTIMHFHK